MLALSLLFPLVSLAYTPSPEMISSPALLVDYTAWSKREDEFNRPGSPTRAFRELVEILYDRGSNRPWGDGYFPEANRRLSAFCAAVPELPACANRPVLRSDADVIGLEALLSSARMRELLGERLSLVIEQWSLPLHEPVFSLVAGPLAEKISVSTGYWDLGATSVSCALLRHPLLGDFDNYVAAFNGDSVPALFALEGEDAVALDDWRLRDRAMDFASRWKHVIGANRRFPPKSAIVDAVELQFQRMYDEQAAEFAAVYSMQLGLVSGDALARFQKERASGDYPEETYQQVAYRQLREAALVQSSYLSLAGSQRKNTSARQQALESLLTLQRYSVNPRFVAMELTTRMTPLASDAYVISEVADFTLAQVYVLELLKALLGIDVYKEASYPALGGSLAAPELFGEDYLTEYAPEVKAALAGRDFASLTASEQLRILRLYLVQTDGKIRPTGLFRLAAVLLTGTNADELHALADRVHEARKGNFK